MARLVSRGKDLGVLPFFFKIRNVETHELLEGVEVGDIGPKLGYGHKDNGFMAFNKFRVPASALLSKFNRLDEKGVLTR